MARSAGLWGADDLTTSAGDTILFTGAGNGADGFCVESPAAAAEQAGAPLEAGKVVISRVALDGPDGAVVVQNLSPESVQIGGWFLCQFPNYWPIPAKSLEPREELTLSAAAGENTDDTFFAAGTFGTLNAGGGEVGLYRDQQFGSASSMVAYVGWNGGGGRLGVAQDAGLWGNGDLTPSDGDTLAYAGEGSGADAYSVSSGGSASSVGTGDPEVSTAGAADGEDDDGYAGPGY